MSEARANPHTAGAAYNKRDMVVAVVTSCIEQEEAGHETAEGVRHKET